MKKLLEIGLVQLGGETYGFLAHNFTVEGIRFADNPYQRLKLQLLLESIIEKLEQITEIEKSQGIIPGYQQDKCLHPGTNDLG